MLDASKLWNMKSTIAPIPPVFGIRSDGEAGASSASDLLITVFGELVRPGGGTVWTQTLVATLALVGVEEKATRQAVSRLADKGWVTSERVGRRTRWHLTAWATEVLARGAERIYGLGRTDVDWDGTWLVLLASVPEAQRAQRGPLGVRLGWAGFGSVGQGVWVSPHVEREAEVERVLADFEISGTALFRSEMTATGDPLSLAQRAWQPDRLATEYQAFLETIEPLAPTDDASMTGDLIRLVDAWRRFPLLDPDLPPALLPSDWPGDDAARAFTQKRTNWAPSAIAWWSAIDADFD